MKKRKDVSVKSFFNWSNEKKQNFVSFFDNLSDEEYEFCNCLSVKKGKIQFNMTSFHSDKEKVARFENFINSLTPEQREFVCVYCILSPIARLQVGVKK